MHQKGDRGPEKGLQAAGAQCLWLDVTTQGNLSITSFILRHPSSEEYIYTTSTASAVSKMKAHI
jgi:hypothetical protein